MDRLGDGVVLIFLQEVLPRQPLRRGGCESFGGLSIGGVGQRGVVLAPNDLFRIAV